MEGGLTSQQAYKLGIGLQDDRAVVTVKMVALEEACRVAEPNASQVLFHVGEVGKAVQAEMNTTSQLLVGFRRFLTSCISVLRPDNPLEGKLREQAGIARNTVDILVGPNNSGSHRWDCVCECIGRVSDHVRKALSILRDQVKDLADEAAVLGIKNKETRLAIDGEEIVLCNLKASLEVAAWRIRMMYGVAFALCVGVGMLWWQMTCLKKERDVLLAESESDFIASVTKSEGMRRITVECPGVSSEDIVIRTVQNSTTISISRKRLTHRGALLSSAGRWERTFRFPVEEGHFLLQEDQALLEHGILTVVLKAREDLDRVLHPLTDSTCVTRQDSVDAYEVMQRIMTPSVLDRDASFCSEDDPSGVEWTKLNTSTNIGECEAPWVKN